MLGGAFSSALPHLRTVNPHVASIVASAVAAGGLAPHLPRQECAAVVPGDDNAQRLMGISSFAFQVRLHFWQHLLMLYSQNWASA